MISIKGMNKAEVLKALYDHSHVQGLGFIEAVPDGTVTVEHCEELLKKRDFFDAPPKRRTWQPGTGRACGGAQDETAWTRGVPKTPQSVVQLHGLPPQRQRPQRETDERVRK